MREEQSVFFKGVALIGQPASSGWTHSQKNMGNIIWTPWVIKKKNRGHEVARRGREMWMVLGRVRGGVRFYKFKIYCKKFSNN